MKNHLSAILATALLLSSLTGCSDQNTSSENNSLPNASNSTNNYPTTSSEPKSSQESSTSTTENSSAPSESNNEEKKLSDVFGDSLFDSNVEINDENRWIIDVFLDKFKKQGTEVLAPDGSALELQEAITASGNKDKVGSLRFDFAYIFYTKPYCITSIDNTCEDIENKKATISSKNYSDMIKVKAGDILDNGLKVTVPKYYQSSSSDESSDEYERFYHQWVEFEGELTLNGYFVYSPYKEVHAQPESVYFVPDSANDCLLPTLESEPHYWYNEYGTLSTTERLIIRNSETNRPETLDKFPENLKDKKIIKVSATIKDPILSTLPKNSAELVSYEIIKG